MDIKKPQLVKVEAFVLVFWVGSATPSEIFSENQRSDFITRSLRLLYYDLAKLFLLVEPFITALSALFEGISHAGV